VTANGAFTAEDLPPGEYLLLCTDAESGASVNEEVRVEAEGKDVEISLAFE
jgi:hypothetical protein